MGTGERSERIRTYNFPQGRVTDHRIGLTLYRLDGVLGGDLDEILHPLTTHYQAEALKGEIENSKFQSSNPNSNKQQSAEQFGSTKFQINRHTQDSKH